MGTSLEVLQAHTRAVEAERNENLNKLIGRGSAKADLRSVAGWEDMPSIDDWAKKGVTFTSTGLEFSPDVTQQDFVDLGGYCGTLNNSTKLWVGDWAAYGQLRWNYTRDDLAAMAALDVETVDNYLSIGRKVPVSNRLPGLTPRHYAAVASLERRDQTKALKQAKAHKWTSDMLRAKVNGYKEFGLPLDGKALFPADVKRLRESALTNGTTGNGNGHTPAAVVVERETLHIDDYKLALLRDSADVLPDLFELDEIQPETEIEVTIGGLKLAQLIALLESNLPDDLEIGIKVTGVKVDDDTEHT